MRHVLLPLIVSCCCAAAGAADWYVAVGGNAGADGRSPSTALATVQAGVDHAGPGDTVHVGAGTYRAAVVVHRSGTAAAPLTIRGDAGATICGSAIVGGWQPYDGEVYRVPWTVASQTVFADGAALRQIGPVAAHYAGSAADGSWMYRPTGSGPADLVRGSFFAGGGWLYVRLGDGGAPAGRLIEASTIPRLLTFDAAATAVRVVGMRFRHSNISAIQQIGAAIELGSGCALEDCDVQWCDFAGVMLAWQGHGARIERCVVSNNGDCGIQGGRHGDLVIRDTVCAGNNWRGFNGQWHGGGIKLTTASWGLLERVEAAGNAGNGIWFDFCDSGQLTTVRACHSHDNRAPGEGLIAEGSRDLLVVDNLIAGNGRRGIYVSASDRVRVFHNTVVGTTGFSAIDVAGMPRAGRTLTAVRISGNIIAANTSTSDLRIVRENGGDIRDLRADHNLFWRAGASPRLWWGADGRGNFVGQTWSSVAAYATATPFGVGCVEGDPRFTGGDCQLAAGSPAIDAGVDLGVATDRLGHARPAGSAPDLGACEYSAGDGTSGGGTGGAPPSVARAPSGQISAGGRTIVLDALGADDAGEAALTYSWRQTAGPSPLTIVRNGDNAAKRTAAIAAAAGAYAMRLTITDRAGATTTADLAVTVPASPTRLRLTPTAAWARAGERRAFAAQAIDQFLRPLAVQPAVAWSSDAGAIDGNGGFTAGGGTGTVTARAGALSAGARVTDDPTFACAIDFAPAGSAIDDGCLGDDGAVFADRGNGFAYGWSTANPTGRDRTTGTNRRDDTLIRMPPSGRWEIRVPAGTYHVRACVGDATHVDGRQHLQVEGVDLVDGQPGDTRRWLIGEAEVEVRDGRLTIAAAADAVDAKLCWIELAGVGDGPG